MKGKPWTVGEEKQLRQLIEAGKSVRVIAKILGKTRDCVRMKLARLGLEVVVQEKKNVRTTTTTELILPEELPSIQPYFQDIKLSSVESDWRKLFEVKERTGLLGLPENVQRLMIRTIYYPNPSEEEIVLIHLLLNEALSPEKALPLSQNRAIKMLVEQGQIAESRGRLYLSDEGKIVAKGALQIYPELSEINKRTSICSE